MKIFHYYSLFFIRVRNEGAALVPAERGRHPAEDPRGGDRRELREARGFAEGMTRVAHGIDPVTPDAPEKWQNLECKLCAFSGIQ